MAGHCAQQTATGLVPCTPCDSLGPGCKEPSWHFIELHAVGLPNSPTCRDTRCPHIGMLASRTGMPLVSQMLTYTYMCSHRHPAARTSAPPPRQSYSSSLTPLQVQHLSRPAERRVRALHPGQVGRGTGHRPCHHPSRPQRHRQSQHCCHHGVGQILHQWLQLGRDPGAGIC